MFRMAAKPVGPWLPMHQRKPDAYRPMSLIVAYLMDDVPQNAHGAANHHIFFTWFHRSKKAVRGVFMLFFQPFPKWVASFSIQS